MRWWTAVLVFSAGVACSAAPRQSAQDGAASPVVDAAPVARALSGDPQQVAEGVRELRAAGPAGLAALLDTVSQSGADAAQARPIIDAVAAQRDAHASGLYWHTDLATAKARAEREGKPILSLRLLGRLDQDFSCANSRFFRLALYSHPEIASFLRDKFVLHWSSERPAPRISIDFGDGRRIERTITGNSAHYVLDSRGRVVDALPGMYGPTYFLAQLRASERMARQTGELTEDDDAQAVLGDYHRQAVARTQAEWSRELQGLGIVLPATQVAPSKGTPNAAQAAPVAITKMAVEAPLVRAVVTSARQLQSLTDAGSWQKLAKTRLAGSRLHENSRQLIREKTPVQLDPASGQTGPVDDAAFDRLIAAFERQVALDTIQNEYLLHRRIHEWLAADRPELAGLNRRVYAELFLTPKRDPWLGLLPPDTLSGLPRDGVTLR